MKPDNQTPNIKINKLLIRPGQGSEIEPTLVNPEANDSSYLEKERQNTELIPKNNNVVTVTTLPAPSTNARSDDNMLLFGVPDVAADDDLIEKEWVDKAKQIVNQTKDDPHQREKGVTKLKVNYLKKRFGRELDSAA